MMTNEETADQAHDLNKTYQDYIDKLNAIKTENERLFARNTLIISGGAFTLSVTILKDIYKYPLPWTKWFLIASWVFFGLCAFLQFYSDHLSSRAMNIGMKNFKEYWFKGNGEAKERLNKYDGWVQKINALTPWIICAGFCCMIIFSASNFLYSKGDQMNKKTTPQNVVAPILSQNKTTKGVTLPTPPEKPKPTAEKPNPKSG